MVHLEHCESCGKTLPECTKCQKWHQVGKLVSGDHSKHYDFDYQINVEEHGNVETHFYCRDC